MTRDVDGVFIYFTEMTFTVPKYFETIPNYNASIVHESIKKNFLDGLSHYDSLLRVHNDKHLLVQLLSENNEGTICKGENIN